MQQKPNVMINKQSIEGGEFQNNTINKIGIKGLTDLYKNI